MLTYIIIRDRKEDNVSNYWLGITICIALLADMGILAKFYLLYKFSTM
jgi:uncharacterized membrane protein